jgi:acetyl esterase/lipase
MKRFEKLALKLFSKLSINLKKHYKLFRKAFNAVNSPKEPVYKMLDHKMMVEDREIPVRLFVPKDRKAQKVLIFFHGGGWVIGGIDSYTNVCAALANKTGHSIISVDYRLAPEHPFPAGLEDCYHVTKEIFLNLDILKCKQEDITLIGDSAGGNLAAVVSLRARDFGDFLPKKQILIYPVTNYDHTESSPYPSVIENGKNYILTSERVQDYMELYVPTEKDRYSPYVAPILSKDLSNQPNTLIITSEFDPLRDEGEAYGKKLRSFGNDVIIYRMKDALHGFLTNAVKSDDSEKCYEIIDSFLNDKKLK